MYAGNGQRELTDHEYLDGERVDDHLIHDQLIDHLIHDHGRPSHEMIGLPFGALHKLEHFEHSMGLLDLRHSHS